MHTGIPGKVLACVVTYDPDQGFKNRIKRIKRQVDKVLVVNNFDGRDMSSDSYELLENGNIGGIAGALNKALDYALENDYGYLCLFDHDSDVPDGLVAALVKEAYQGQATIVGPIYINSATGKAGRFVLDINGKAVSKWISKDLGVIPAYFVITSGTLINLKLLPSDVRYNESLSLDMVDVDFCLSLKSSGNRIFLHTGVCMSHGIGNKKNGSSRLSPPNYSLARHRSIIINRVRIWRKWYCIFPSYVRLDLIVTSADFLRNIMFMRNRFSYIRSFISGLVTGMRQ